MDLKAKITIALFTLALLPNCAPVGDAVSSKQSSSVQAENSNIDPQSIFSGGPGRVPPQPPPPPAPVAPPPPAVPPPPAGSDFVCTHFRGGSFCNSKDTRINFDRMEKYVRDNNPDIERPAYAGHITGPKEAVICFQPGKGVRHVVAGYPIIWACANGETGYFAASNLMTNNAPIDVPSRLFASRTVVGARPAAGFRSYRHNNAPFRCFGGLGYRVRTDYPNGEVEMPTYANIRFNMYCLFNNDVVSAESLADAVAEANDFAVLGDTRLRVTCTLKTLLPGFQVNRVQINALDCRYD